ncbi:VCBS repeat-containing protein [Streptomyces axinellae]|uniref:VCBS repeat-containing protein n=1 Tax=Streptomyces axinellae TaxID=552788 RepID=A0ABN3Q182_9ACTN
MLRTRRSRLIASSLTAVTLGLTVAGYQAGAAVTSPSDGAVKSVASTAHTAQAANAAKAGGTCLTDATTLVGDLDGDGNMDLIGNPGHNGTKMTIQWGAKDGSFGKKHTVKDLVGAGKGEVATAAVADFQNDGTLDMVVSIVEPSGGDDPNTSSLSEFRPGPLDRTDLTSPDAVHSDVGDKGEVQQLSIAKYNDDEFPDLAVRNNNGDGMTNRDVRLSQPDGTLGEYDGKANGQYGDSGTWGEPPAMPKDGWKQFYKPCA